MKHFYPKIPTGAQISTQLPTLLGQKRKVAFHQFFLILVKAAYSVTFDLLILELMFLFFKNTVQKLKFRYTFYQFCKSKQIISIKTTAFKLKLPVYNYWRDANNYKQDKNTPVL